MNTLKLQRKNGILSVNGRTQKLFVNGEEHTLIGDRISRLELPDGEYLVETERSQGITVDLKNDRTVELLAKPKPYIYIILALVILPLILKFGFSVDKIITFDYVTYCLYAASGVGILLNTILKKYTEEIVDKGNELISYYN